MRKTNKQESLEGVTSYFDEFIEVNEVMYRGILHESSNLRAMKDLEEAGWIITRPPSVVKYTHEFRLTPLGKDMLKFGLL